MSKLYTQQQLDTIELRMYQVRRLKELNIDLDILNTEALMLVLSKKYRAKDGSRLLFKYLDSQDDEPTMKSKSKTIIYLNQSDYNASPDLVIPEYGVVVDNSLTGFALPLIENHVNMGTIINNENASFKEKKQLLILLGKLLDRVSRIDAPNKLHFGDLNEYNFILDSSRNLKAIDLDSSYVEALGDDTKINPAYYLHKNPHLKGLPEKYHTTESGTVIPNEESDIYCYIMIILKALSGTDIFKKNIETYYRYLDYLRSIGISDELIESFFNVYTGKSNKISFEAIEEITPKQASRADYISYVKKMT